MAKRARLQADGEDVPPSANESCHDDAPLEMLSAWCEEKMKTSVHSCSDFLDAVFDARPHFEDFIGELCDEQEIVVVGENNRAALRAVWESTFMDAHRAHALSSRMQKAFPDRITEADEFENSSCKTALNKMLAAVAKEQAEGFDSCFLDLGWELARTIMHHGSEEAPSDQNAPSNSEGEESLEEESSDFAEEETSSSSSASGDEEASDGSDADSSSGSAET